VSEDKPWAYHGCGGHETRDGGGEVAGHESGEPVVGPFLGVPADQGGSRTCFAPRYRGLLPEPLQMPERPAVLVVVVDNRDVGPWPLAPYREGYVALRCRHMGEEGWYPHTMPVNQRAAMSAGRRLALPKYVADEVTLAPTEQGWLGEVHHLGEPRLRVEFKPDGGPGSDLARERGFPMFTLHPAGRQPQVLRLDWNDGDGGNQRASSGTVEVELGPNDSWSDLLARPAKSSGWFEEFEGSASLVMHDRTSNPGDEIVEGEVAVVTGAASGIGRALCIELARRGAVVVVTDRDVEGARRVAAEIEQTGGRAEAEYLDVTVADDVDAVVNRTLDRHARLDYMFNNAGITIGGELRDVTRDQWRRIIDINLWGTINGTRSAYRVMTERGTGQIVNISSAAGLTPSPLNAPYAATKHAIVGLSTSLRPEVARLGVGLRPAEDGDHPPGRTRAAGLQDR